MEHFHKLAAIASWSNVAKTTTELTEFNMKVWSDAQRSHKTVLPRGSGRSFGDAAFNGRGITFHSRGLKQLHINEEQHSVTCDAGVLIGRLHQILDSSGWHFPVYGGTQWVTVGGAAAADIHGKNHPAVGSFGKFVLSLELVLPDSSVVVCSPEKESSLFFATVGGMGLTGFIRSLTLRILPGRQEMLMVSWSSVRGMQEVYDAFNDRNQTYQVCGFVDFSRSDVRGLYSSAVEVDIPHLSKNSRTCKLRLPKVCPWRPKTIRALDAVVHKLPAPLRRYMNPQDYNYSGTSERLMHWNSLFGLNGFFEYQFALQSSEFQQAISDLRSDARNRGLNLCFAVIKRFGSGGGGFLSFPRAGFTCNFQVRATDEARKFLIDLTDRLSDLGAQVYLAKDAVLLQRHVPMLFPKLAAWQQVAMEVDPAGRVSSDLSVRLGFKPWAK